MILLFTDFGVIGPYVGQLEAVLRRLAPGVDIVNLQADAPAFRPDLAAYLLAAQVSQFVPGDVVLAVVDPGVGGPRAPWAMQADGIWYVGPDNGLLAIVRRRARQVADHRIDWRPERLSASFHGRDMFAPIAAALATGRACDITTAAPEPFDHWPDDLAAIVYVDAYGNATTGLRGSSVDATVTLVAGGRALPRARTFDDVDPGMPFAYENSQGLLEIALNRGSAAAALSLELGSPLVLGRIDCQEPARQCT